MKKIFIYILLCIPFFTNCSKELQVFSCDPDVNDWVLANKVKYANISRSEFHQFTLDQQRGLYGSFTGEEKVKLWNEKLNYLLTTQKLSDEEKTYLVKLFMFVKPYHFDTEKGRETFNEFANKWAMDASSKLGWDEKKIFLYTHILLTIEEWQIAVEERRKAITASDTTKSEVEPHYPLDCECYYSIYCQLRDSGIPTKSTKSVCMNAKCNKVASCGIMGNSNCTGLCQ